MFPSETADCELTSGHSWVNLSDSPAGGESDEDSRRRREVRGLLIAYLDVLTLITEVEGQTPGPARARSIAGVEAG
jgi:hypothetical protein